MPALKSATSLAILKYYEAPDERPLSEARVAAVQRLTERLALAPAQSEEIARKIRALAAVHFAPLTTLRGVNLLTAGTLAGIPGHGRRFVSDAALASYAGVSPLQASSAGHPRHRLNRGGDRRLNAVVYIDRAHASALLAGGKGLSRTADGAARRLILTRAQESVPEGQATYGDQLHSDHTKRDR